MTPAQRKDLLARIAAFHDAEDEANEAGEGMSDTDPIVDAYYTAADLIDVLSTILASERTSKKGSVTYTPIGHGYAVSDRAAGALARGVGRKLPRLGYALRVALPCGALAWLARTPLQASRRGWTWYVDTKGAT